MSKEERPEARLPSGFADAFSQTVIERQKMIESILATYRMFGFEPLETPAIEYLDALGKFLPDVDQPDQGVFALRDDDKLGQWIALRYDLTAPLARTVAEHGADLPSPYRRYQYGPVWRREKPGPGRFRQFYQCDFDTVGTATMAVDAEVCAVLSQALESVGIAPHEYEIRVNNRKVLSGVLARAGVSEPATQLQVLRSIDKLDKLGVGGVRSLLGSGRTDQSGDETEGANLEEGQIDVILAFVSAGDPSRDTVLAALKDLVGDDPTGLQGVQELTEINQLLGAMGPMSQVVFDPTVVRGLEYYTGPVFEAALTFETVDDDGNAKQFGSVAGGGRYDDLVKRFTGEDVAACGASIGVDRLLAAIRTRRADSVESSGPVVVTVMDRAHLADYQSMVTEIRQAGIPAELYLGTSGFGKQLKYADKRNSRVVVIAGEREFDASSVVVRDMVVGAGRAAAIADRQEWLDDRSAQQQVPRSDLVAAVQAVLARA